MNKLTGEKVVTIQGQDYVMRFTWRAIAEVESKHGGNPNLFDPKIIADVAAAGLREKHPELTAEKIMDLSPPLIPFAKTVQAAVQWAYFGNESVPADDGVKKNPPASGLRQRIKSLFQRVLGRMFSGILRLT